MLGVYNHGVVPVQSFPTKQTCTRLPAFLYCGAHLRGLPAAVTWQQQPVRAWPVVSPLARAGLHWECSGAGSDVAAAAFQWLGHLVSLSRAVCDMHDRACEWTSSRVSSCACLCMILQELPYCIKDAQHGDRFKFV